jgi:hypothetical protein
VNRGIALGVAADQLVLAIDANVVLVTVVAFSALLGPTRVLVLLRVLGRLLLPYLGRFAPFDRLVLVTAVALLGRADNGGVDDLATARYVALGIKVAIEAVEQRLD